MVDAITILEPFDFGEEELVPHYSTRKILPDGYYNVMIDNISIGSKADTRTFVVSMQVLDGDWKGNKIVDFYNIYKSKLSANKFKLLLTMLGLTKYEIIELGKDINNLLDVIVGLKLKVKTKQEEGYTRIDKLTRPEETYTNGSDILRRYKEKQELLKKTSDKQGLW